MKWLMCVALLSLSIQGCGPTSSSPGKKWEYLQKVVMIEQANGVRCYLIEGYPHSLSCVVVKP